MMQQPTNFQPGIYFNLSNEAYHADGALGSSGIKLIRQAPIEYWWQCQALNPNAVPITSEAMTESDMFHMLLLEPDRFLRHYQVMPGKKFDPNKKVINQITYDKLVFASRLIMAKPRTGQMFRDGFCEASIFVRHPATGVMIKVRPDYLKVILLADYKAHRRLDAYSVQQDIVTYGYDIQAGLYQWAVEEWKRQYRGGNAGAYYVTDEGDVYDTLPENMQKFVEAMIAYEQALKFIFTFQRKTPPYISRPLEMASDVLELGLIKSFEAIDTYAQCLEKYGTNPWPDGEDVIEMISLDDLPQRVLRR